MLSWFSAEKRFDKHAKRVASRRAYAPDRWESIRFLANLGTEAAATALLQRFDFTSDPTITDQEEKEAVFEALRELGEPVVIGPLLKHCRSTKSLGLPLKLLAALQSDERLVASLRELLAEFSTAYARDPQKKLQLLGFLPQPLAESLCVEVERFTNDANEGVRFLAYQTLRDAPGLDESTQSRLEAQAQADESRRIQLLMAEARASTR